MTTLTREIAQNVLHAQVLLHETIAAGTYEHRVLLQLQQLAVREENALALACEHAEQALRRCE